MSGLAGGGLAGGTCVGQILFGQHDKLGLGELALEQVVDFGGKTAGRAQRVIGDREGGDPKGAVGLLLEGADHGGLQVGAAANRFGQDHVGGDTLLQGRECPQQIGVTAAKTAAGHLDYGELVVFEQCGIDQLVALVVGHQPYPLAAGGKFLGSCEQQRGLAGAQKAADQDQRESHTCLNSVRTTKRQLVTVNRARQAGRSSSSPRLA